MKLNSRSSRLLIATLALGVGVAVLFWGHKLEWVRQFDLAAVRSAEDAPGKQLHEYDPATGKISIRPLVATTEAGKTFQRVIVTDDPEKIFESSPPSALDYAVLLESLHNHGYRHVTVTTRLNWNDDPGLLADGLDLRLALFDSAVIPLAVTRGPSTGSLPKMLERTIIPDTQIHGDARLVPLVNRLTLPSHMTGDAAHVFAGFHHIESNPPAAGRIAMLARWDDKGMIPSLELLMIMQAHAVLPSQVTIHCGKYIRLGKNGPIIAIDSYGQTTTPGLTENNTPSPPLQADKLITQKKSKTALKPIAIIHAQGERTGPTNAFDANRLNQAIALTRAYPVPGDGSSHQRLPLWGKLVILFDVAVIVFLLRTMTRGNQHLGFALTAALTLPMLYAMMSLTQHWMAISAPLAALLIGWIIPFSNRRSTSVMPEYNPSDPKPVIRA